MLLYCATCSCSTSRVKRDETGNQARRGDQYSLPLTPDCLVVKTSRVTAWAHSVPGTWCCEPIKNDLRHMCHRPLPLRTLRQGLQHCPNIVLCSDAALTQNYGITDGS